MDPNSSFLTTKRVLERYGISAMSLWRWERDEKVGFPKPMIVNRRKLYRLGDVEAWERKRAASPVQAA